MGLLNFLSGGRASGGSFDRQPSGGNLAGNSGSYSAALAPTTQGVITPANPGNFGSIRSAPIVQAPRYFNRQEAAALKQLATQQRQNLASTKSAYKSLSQGEKADATVHTLHRDYETVVGRSEAKKKRSDARHAKAMIGLMPAYAGMHQSVQLAGERAAAQIQADQSARLARHAQAKSRLQGVR